MKTRQMRLVVAVRAFRAMRIGFRHGILGALWCCVVFALVQRVQLFNDRIPIDPMRSYHDGVGQLPLFARSQRVGERTQVAQKQECFCSGKVEEIKKLHVK